VAESLKTVVQDGTAMVIPGAAKPKKPRRKKAAKRVAKKAAKKKI